MSNLSRASDGAILAYIGGLTLIILAVLTLAGSFAVAAVSADTALVMRMASVAFAALAALLGLYYETATFTTRPTRRDPRG